MDGKRDVGGAAALLPQEELGSMGFAAFPPRLRWCLLQAGAVTVWRGEVGSWGDPPSEICGKCRVVAKV